MSLKMQNKGQLITARKFVNMTSFVVKQLGAQDRKYVEVCKRLWLLFATCELRFSKATWTAKVMTISTMCTIPQYLKRSKVSA